ncbi:MAG: hypothetical protein ABI040_07665 [Rhodoferax sp.]
MRVTPVVELRAELTKLVRSKRAVVRLSKHARIVQRTARCPQNKDIAGQLGVGRLEGSRWCKLDVQAGPQGVKRDLPRAAPPLKVDVQKLVRLIAKPEAVTHWNVCKMAAQLGVGVSTVMRHWQSNGLKPHVVGVCKALRDPVFVQKLEDIVGLYMGEVIEVFHAARQHALTPHEALARLQPLMPAAGCNGYWHGLPGLEQQGSAAGEPATA